MPSIRSATPRLVLAAAACSALFAAGLPSATAAPSTDSQGYVDSTARCTPPEVVVAFGSTATSRVAVCKSPGGQFEYRGVRVRDGARLIVPATSSGSGGYVAKNDGITYTLTEKSLVVSAGNRVIREESMVDFHAPGGMPAATAPSTATAPSPTPAPAPPSRPLPAEVGGAGG